MDERDPLRSEIDALYARCAALTARADRLEAVLREAVRRAIGHREDREAAEWLPRAQAALDGSPRLVLVEGSEDSLP